MTQINSIEALEALYEAAVPASLTKVATKITPLYRRWIEASRFAVVSTVGPEGTDASPRGDTEPVARIVDQMTLHLADWRGNNRLGSLRNIIRDPRISLMFMVPGSNNVVRINGAAVVSVDPSHIAPFEKKGMAPRTVIVVTVGEMYFQCAKALMRSGLCTSENESNRVPSAGEFLKEMTSDFDGDTYDKGYAEYAKARMW